MNWLLASGALLGVLSGCTADTDSDKDDSNNVVTRAGEGGCPPGGTTSSEGQGGSGSTAETTSNSSTTSGGEGGAGGAAGTGGDPGTGGAGGAAPEPAPTILDKRVVDYNEALRTASIKLVGTLPTLQQIEDLRTATDRKVKYEQFIDEMMADVRFKKKLVDFWRNEFRMGGTALKDTAPTFAARLTYEGRAFSELFTATTNTCPTFNGTDFVDGSCTNTGATPTAGILTNPGVMAHYYANGAFRRLRFFQEVFACRKMPSEYSATPIPMGNGNYTSPWPFMSIAGAANGGRIDFLDTSSAICANCHGTMNHRAPLFGNFDANGVLQSSIQVKLPLDGSPTVLLSDWLPPGEVTAYKFGQNAANLTEYGQHMAADQEVQTCAVTRVWNWAMSRGDAVYDAADVPSSVIGPLVTSYKVNGQVLRNTIRSVFTHDDFVRF